MEHEELILKIIELLGRRGKIQTGMSISELSMEMGDPTLFSPDGEPVADKIKEAIKIELRTPQPRIQEVRRNGRRKRDWYKIQRVLPPPPPPSDPNYTGAAGECAVMSELLFRGFNVNRMTVDEGIDIVASKNNIFYFIQVKTTNLDKDTNRASVSIKKSSFNNVLSNQVRYVMVIRDKGEMTYLLFDQNDIQRYMAQGYMLDSPDTISIKIRFGSVGHPYLYHNGHETDAQWHVERFLNAEQCL